MNLIGNAIDAVTIKGTIRINSRIETVVGQTFQVVVISDNGSGIPAELHQKVFDPFFTTKDVGKGTGLGLSIVYGIIEKHHGSISLASEAGKGTEFTIRLPVETVDSASDTDSLRAVS